MKVCVVWCREPWDLESGKEVCIYALKMYGDRIRAYDPENIDPRVGDTTFCGNLDAAYSVLSKGDGTSVALPVEQARLLFPQAVFADA